MTEKPKSITDKKTLKLMVIVDPYLYKNIQVCSFDILRHLVLKGTVA
jgi:hypothetical protein